ncbi:MAG: TetR/AcrR family transcriptional regulator [Actinomycetota bacterium]
MGYRHRREDILAGAVDAVLDDGIGQLTFGRLAARLGINDRTIVYYFPNKDALVTEALMALGVRLQAGLEASFNEPSADHRALVQTAWPTLARDEMDPVFAVMFELNGLAVAGREPYAALAPQLARAFVAWLEPFIDGDAEYRLVEARAAVVVVDALLLARQLLGPEVADELLMRLTDPGTQ